MCRDCGGQLPRSLAILWGVGAVGGVTFYREAGALEPKVHSEPLLSGWVGWGWGGGSLIPF